MWEVARQRRGAQQVHPVRRALDETQEVLPVRRDGRGPRRPLRHLDDVRAGRRRRGADDADDIGGVPRRRGGDGRPPLVLQPPYGPVHVVTDEGKRRCGVRVVVLGG